MERKPKDFYMIDGLSRSVEDAISAFNDAYVAPLQNAIKTVKEHLNVEVSKEAVLDIIQNGSQNAIDAFVKASRKDNMSFWEEDAFNKSFAQTMEVVHKAVDIFRSGLVVLGNRRIDDLELLDFVDINPDGEVTINEAGEKAVAETVLVFVKSPQGKRLCEIAHEVAPLLQEFLDITESYIKDGVMPAQLNAVRNFYFPFHLFQVVEDDNSHKTITARQMDFDPMTD